MLRPRLLLGALALAFLAGCHSRERKLVENAPYISLNLNDSYGARIRFAQPPQRLFVLSPNTAEIIYAIGAEERIAAVGADCDYPEAVRTKPAFTTEPELDLKTLLENNPDGVVVNDEIVANSDLFRQIFTPFALPVLFQRYQTVPQILANIRQLGTVTQHEASANALADSLTQMCERFRTANANAERLKVVCVVSDNPLQVVGGTHFLNDLLGITNCENPFSGRKAPFVRISPVELLASNADAIWFLNEDPNLLKRIADVEPRVMQLPAVVKGNVYRPEKLQAYYRPGPRLVSILAELTATLHPQVKTQELLTEKVER
jgi:iron complex transport system substrate-binding protein